jgi:hypothetical protein
MKKITLSLFAVVSAIGSAFSQANISIVTPTINATTQVRLPNGTSSHKSMKGVMLIRQSELTALTASQVTSAGFILFDGTDPANAIGTFSLWLENTGDNTNNKTALGFAAAVAPMQQKFANTWTVSNTAVQTTVNVPFTSNFTYTGGGIYVAWAWEENTPSPNTQTYSATWRANIGAPGNALCATSNATNTGGSANTLSPTDFRPVIIFNAQNLATNELEVMHVSANGKVAKLDGAHTIDAVIKNNGTAPVSNVPVGLLVTGANPTTATQNVPSITAGGTAAVQFTMVSTVSGVNNITVGVNPVDQNVNNNIGVASQSVTCNEIALHPDLTAGSYTSSGYGAGANAGGIIYSFRYRAGTNANATGVRLVIPGFSSASNINKVIYPVIMEVPSGLIIGQGNPVTITASMLDQFSTHSFTAAVPLVAGNEYNFGIAMPTNQYFPIGNAGFDQLANSPFSTINSVGYYQSPIAGNAFTFINYGNLSLEGVMSFSTTQITAAPNKTAVCKGSPQQVTITATGADTYVYNVPGLGTSGTAVWTPTISGNQTAVSLSVTGNYTSGVATGCKSNVVAMTFTLLACTGVIENTGADAISVYPNPSASGISTISNMSGSNVIAVYNMLGQAVFTKTTDNSTEDLDLSAQPAGNYLVKITNSDNETRIVKLIK